MYLLCCHTLSQFPEELVEIRNLSPTLLFVISWQQGGGLKIKEDNSLILNILNKMKYNFECYYPGNEEKFVDDLYLYIFTDLYSLFFRDSVGGNFVKASLHLYSSLCLYKCVVQALIEYSGKPSGAEGILSGV